MYTCFTICVSGVYLGDTTELPILLRTHWYSYVEPMSPSCFLLLIAILVRIRGKKDIVTKANILIENCDDEKTKNSFKNKRIVLAHKQPPNLLRRLSNARFRNPINISPINGIFKCNNKICKICRLYIQECSSFITANNFEWQIKSHITCNSKNVLYYLKCKICQGKCTYTGKTNVLRKRTNNHISCCRLGTGTNIFDKHVYACKAGKNVSEPYFELYAFMVVKDENSLRTYEQFLHNKGYDTMNKPA